MSGLFLLAVLAILGVVAILVAHRIARPVRNTWLRTGATAVLTIAFMTLLVVDELIGGFQFRALCKADTSLKINAEKIRGRTVKIVVAPLNEILEGKAVAIYHSHESFRDTATNEEIASNDWYVAKGGWFIRLLGVLEKNDPLIIVPSYCYPSLGRQEIAEAYGFSLTK